MGTLSCTAKGHWLVAAVILGMSGAALADNDSRACRVETLNGLYVFSANGFTIAGGIAQPKAIVELIQFNGDGTLTVPGATRSINGVIAQFRDAGGLGSYTLGEDCIGTVSFNGPLFDMFVSPKGEDLWMIQTNPNNVFMGNVTRVSR